MLLIIHNLPWQIRYNDIKAMLQEKCGLTDMILDNLVPDPDTDNKGKKVTVGLPSEEDAAILVRKMDGMYVNRHQLYIEDVRNKKSTVPSYKISESVNDKLQLNYRNEPRSNVNYQMSANDQGFMSQQNQGWNQPTYQPLMLQEHSSMFLAEPSTSVNSNVQGTTKMWDSYAGYVAYPQWSALQAGRYGPGAAHQHSGFSEDVQPQREGYRRDERPERSERHERSERLDSRRDARSHHSGSRDDPKRSGFGKDAPTQHSGFRDGRGVYSRRAGGGSPRRRSPRRSRSPPRASKRRWEEPRASPQRRPAPSRSPPRSRNRAAPGPSRDRGAPMPGRDRAAPAPNRPHGGPQGDRFQGVPPQKRLQNAPPQSRPRNAPPQNRPQAPAPNRFQGAPTQSRLQGPAQNRIPAPAPNRLRGPAPPNLFQGAPAPQRPAAPAAPAQPRGAPPPEQAAGAPPCPTSYEPPVKKTKRRKRKAHSDAPGPADLERQVETRLRQANNIIANGILDRIGLFDDLHYKTRTAFRRRVRQRVDELVGGGAPSVQQIVDMYEAKFTHKHDEELFNTVISDLKDKPFGDLPVFDTAEVINKDPSMDTKPEKAENKTAPPMQRAPPKQATPYQQATPKQEPFKQAPPKLYAPTTANQGQAPLSQNFKIPKHVGGAKELTKIQKMNSKKEMAELKGHDLPPLYERVLKEELRCLKECFHKEINTPNQEIKQVYNIVNMDELMQEFYMVMRHHLSQRIAGVCNKIIRIFGHPKCPKKELLENFLRPYKPLNLKKSDKGNMFIATLTNYNAFDKLCSKGPFNIGDTVISIKPLHMVAVPKKTNAELNKMIKQFINKQIEHSNINILDKNWQIHEQKLINNKCQEFIQVIERNVLTNVKETVNIDLNKDKCITDNKEAKTVAIDNAMDEDDGIDKNAIDKNDEDKTEGNSGNSADDENAIENKNAIIEQNTVVDNATEVKSAIIDSNATEVKSAVIGNNASEDKSAATDNNAIIDAVIDKNTKENINTQENNEITNKPNENIKKEFDDDFDESYDTDRLIIDENVRNDIVIGKDVELKREDDEFQGDVESGDHNDENGENDENNDENGDSEKNDENGDNDENNGGNDENGENNDESDNEDIVDNSIDVDDVDIDDVDDDDLEDY